jgi:hypothetical protein
LLLISHRQEVTVQIIIPKKLKIILITLLVIVLLLIGFLAIHPLPAPLAPATATGMTPDAQAAVNAVSSFYTLNYTAGIDLWATRVCATATDAGCRAIRGYFAPAVDAMMIKHQIQTSCTVMPVRLISEAKQNRVWQVRVSLDHPWPGLNTSSQDVYVEMANVNGKWLMNRILFEQEQERLPTPTH